MTCFLLCNDLNFLLLCTQASNTAETFMSGIDAKLGLSKKATCLRGRVGEWPSGRVAEINFRLMSTNFYDSGRSYKVKTPHK